MPPSGRPDVLLLGRRGRCLTRLRLRLRLRRIGLLGLRVRLTGLGLRVRLSGLGLGLRGLARLLRHAGVCTGLRIGRLQARLRVCR